MSSCNTYAIIGRGYSAAVNLTTLLLTEFGRQRLADKSVIFFGLSNPWTNFYNHKMGQHAPLLSLPGFKEHPMEEGFLGSQTFADVISKQYELFDKDRIQHQPIQISRIEQSNNNLYTLIGKNGQRFDAEHIDICTGLGPPEAGVTGMSAELKTKWKATQVFFTGHEFLSKTIPVVTKKRVCIIGSGPVASLCCERAIGEGADYICWISNTGFISAFPSSGRFKELAVQSEERKYVPISKSLMMAGYYEAACDPVSDLLPIMRLVAKPNSWIRTHLGEASDPTPYECDILIIARGERNTVNHLFQEPPAWEVVKSKTLHLPIRIESPDNKIRVLGAAALSHEAYKEGREAEESGSGSELLNRYLASLSHQVPRLEIIPVAARFIAESNGFFDEKTDCFGPNWNCAPRTNIEKCCESRNLLLEELKLTELIEQRKRKVFHTIPEIANGHGHPTYSSRDVKE